MNRRLLWVLLGGRKEGGREGEFYLASRFRLIIALMGRWIVSAYTRTHFQLYDLVLSKNKSD